MFKMAKPFWCNTLSAYPDVAITISAVGDINHPTIAVCGGHFVTIFGVVAIYWNNNPRICVVSGVAEAIIDSVALLIVKMVIKYIPGIEFRRFSFHTVYALYIYNLMDNIF